ncbi:MAG: carboxypeptidase regulatory-like domain-containing protein [Fibrobacter sp.]|uniref:carboxypeptidase-like regulatory domain-containing protein n=1 Tax=Fibrobacter sp. TaxID=35828 RepID=UPI0025BF46D3|nr:carboxypeptidase-like regulatory domain-containing protein [Fibrobacter sp.]MBQ3715781.1 carboxypeptidase regulatory-like domain-containing protein [Fibrobacter sp.]MBQ7078151.1 carboxypeptidase regulatory-like domain-containing protein [Fibrobacter sp.]
MFINKLTKTGLAFALLGLGMFVGCSDEGSSTASTLSETNTGNPSVASLDTADFEKKFGDGKSSCVIEALAKKTSKVEDDEEEIEYKVDTLTTLEGSQVIGWGQLACGADNNIYLYADVKGRVVDPSGKPLANAKVYTETSCSPYVDDCQWFTTDDDGYFYMESVNFLTYEEGFPIYADSTKAARTKDGEAKMEHIPVFKNSPARIISDDKKFGTNESLRFDEASMIKVDGRNILDVGNVTLEPAFSVNVPLDSIYFRVIEEHNDDWDVVDAPVEKALERGVYLSIHSMDCYNVNKCYTWTPDIKISLEDVERGYITVDALPENTYDLMLYCKDCVADIYPDTLVVER